MEGMLPFSTLEKCVKNPFCKYPTHPANLGEHIRKRRFDLKLQQYSVAKSLGVSKATLCSWENGSTKPRIYQLPKVIAFLGYNPFNGSTLAEKIKKYRSDFGLTCVQFAKLCRANANLISHWERGEAPSEMHLGRLAELLGQEVIFSS